MPDSRKSLPTLRNEWLNCARCELGEFRIKESMPLVFGEGTTGGIMLIGDAPNKDDTLNSRIFSGRGGALLRTALKRFGMEKYVYLANTVLCRSCGVAYNGEGQPVLGKRDGKPFIRDQRPTPSQVQECAARLYEEIYIVDPLIIVALGDIPAQMLLRKSVSSAAEAGTLKTVLIPGAAHIAVLTEKKKQWVRKVKKQWVAPTAQNMVEYSCIICASPDDALTGSSDIRKGNILQQFAGALQLARDIYLRYRAEVLGGQMPVSKDVNIQELSQEMNDE